MWRTKVLQPVDIRYGCDLRKRQARRWLTQMLDKANPRLAIVEYPCTVWSTLNSNINYQGREEELARLREEDRPFLKLTEDILLRRSAAADTPSQRTQHLQPHNHSPRSFA